MYESLRPLSDRVILRKLKTQTEKPLGNVVIIIPDSAIDEKIQMAEVIAVGPGKEKPLTVILGDKVLIGKYTGLEIEKDIVVVHEPEIIGVL